MVGSIALDPRKIKQLIKLGWLIPMEDQVLTIIGRNIMWKMYDRERDYNSIYDATAQQTTVYLEAPITRNTKSISLVSFLTENASILCKAQNIRIFLYCFLSL
jgi:hypothetical protein